jgi:hypothetical protein
VRTSQYLSWLIQRIPGNLFSRAELLDAVNQAQNEILGRDIKYMRINPDPFIHTIAGTYLYVSSTALFSGVDNSTQYDIREVKRVYSYNVRNTANFAYGGRNRLSHRPDAFVNAYSSDEVDLAFDCTPSIAANSSDCKVAFWRENDPGTQTANIRAVAYRWPTQLTSESIQLMVPDQFQRLLLKAGVLKDLEETEYGRSDYWREIFDKEILKFDAWANGIRGTAGGSTPPREV